MAMASVTPFPEDRPPQEQPRHPNALQVIDGWVRHRKIRRTLVLVVFGVLATVVLVAYFGGALALSCLAAAVSGLYAWRHMRHEPGGGPDDSEAPPGSAARASG
jgi:hypothetical protein